MRVEIDKDSGFCFGVVKAIDKAEEILAKEKTLYSLGDIVHNGAEIKRLEKLGLKTIDFEQFSNLKNCKVLIRAHGEPPKTYQIAKENNITLIDATCPVVLKLQERIKKSDKEAVEDNRQVVIYGKTDHAEVKGLSGQTEDRAIIIQSIEDLDKLDFTRPITMYSQTTKETDKYLEIKSKIAEEIQKVGLDPNKILVFKNTICGQVSNKKQALNDFSKNHDIILFVSGKKSSNGRVSYNVCKASNSNSYFISSMDEIETKWFGKNDFVGICGATSTPGWQMQNVAKMLVKQFNAQIIE